MVNIRGIGPDRFRGTGRTTEQIVNAPLGSVYVWCNGVMDYPRCLVRRLNRTDIKVVPPSWITSDNWRGKELKGVVVDHALKLTPDQYESLNVIRSRIRP